MKSTKMYQNILISGHLVEATLIYSFVEIMKLNEMALLLIEHTKRRSQRKESIIEERNIQIPIPQVYFGSEFVFQFTTSSENFPSLAKDALNTISIIFIRW